LLSRHCAKPSATKCRYANEGADPEVSDVAEEEGSLESIEVDSVHDGGVEECGAGARKDGLGEDGVGEGGRGEDGAVVAVVES